MEMALTKSELLKRIRFIFENKKENQKRNDYAYKKTLEMTTLKPKELMTIIGV